MDTEKIVEMSDRESLKHRYARINWNAHLVPVVREAVANFGSASGVKGHPLPKLELRSKTIDRGGILGDASTAAGEALTIQFGACPGGVDAPAPPGYGQPPVAAGKPALVFAQTPSGAVAVFLYPAGMSAAEPRRIGDYRDPADLTRSRVRRLLRSLLDMHCGGSPRAGKVAEMAEREALKRRYARINWNAHLVPVVRETATDFSTAFGMDNHALPQLALRSDAIDRGEVVAPSDTMAGDALTVQFGVCPNGVDALAPPGYSRPLVAAGTPALVFAQAPSGAVAVFLYHAGTPAANPDRIGDYRDPADLTRPRVRRLLRSLFDMQGNDVPRPAATAAGNHR